MTITASITTAREFWEQVAQPDYRDFVADTADLRKAIHAGSSLYHLYEWVFQQFESMPSRVFSCTSSSDLRAHLIANECPDFGLLRDLADANKHFRVDRPSSQIATATQVVTRSVGWGKARWGVDKWGSPPGVVVEIDQNTLRHFSAIAENVYNMWDGLFQKHGW